MLVNNSKRELCNLFCWGIRTRDSTKTYLSHWLSLRLITTRVLKNLKLRGISRWGLITTSTRKEWLSSFFQTRTTLGLCLVMNLNYCMRTQMDKYDGRVEAILSESWMKRFSLNSKMGLVSLWNLTWNLQLSSFGNLPPLTGCDSHLRYSWEMNNQSQTTCKCLMFHYTIAFINCLAITRKNNSSRVQSQSISRWRDSQSSITSKWTQLRRHSLLLFAWFKGPQGLARQWLQLL